MIPSIQPDSAKDLDLRENLRGIQHGWQTNPLMSGDWLVREYVFTKAETNKRVPHGLTFIPRDILVTYVSAGTVTINYPLVDLTGLDITTSAACTFRLLIGRAA